MHETSTNLIALSRLNGLTEAAFDYRPDRAATERMRAELGLTGLRKARLHGVLRPMGKRDWQLRGAFGATVVQDCVATLDPVTTRIDEPVERFYTAEFTEPTGAEVEMTDDDTFEPLPEVIDLHALLEESLSLALPAFPRAPGVDFADIIEDDPAMDPDTPKPFAALEGLRDKLVSDDD